MDPTTLFGIASSLTGTTKAVIELLATLDKERDARRQLGAALYLEVEHNLDVLHRLQLETPEQLKVTDPAFAKAALTLRVDAHEAALVLSDWMNDDPTGASERESARRFSWPGLLTARAIKAVAELEDGQPTELVERFTPAQSLGFVASKARSLQSLALVADSASPVLKQTRWAVRMRNLREHEESLVSWLRADERLASVVWPAHPGQKSGGD